MSRGGRRVRREQEPPPDALDRALAGDGTDGSPEWRDTVRKEFPEPDLSGKREVRIPVYLSHRLNKYSAQCAAAEGVSREAWIRWLMAERIRDVLGIPIEDTRSDAHADYPKHLMQRLTGDG